MPNGQKDRGSEEDDEKEEEEEHLLTLSMRSNSPSFAE